MYNSIERSYLLKKDLSQSQTLRQLLLCLGLITSSMGGTTLAFGAVFGADLLIVVGVLLAPLGIALLSTSCYLGFKQRNRDKKARSTSSSTSVQSASSRKVSVVVRPSLPSVVELSGESLGSTVRLSEENEDDSPFGTS